MDVCEHRHARARIAVIPDAIGSTTTMLRLGLGVLAACAVMAGVVLGDWSGSLTAAHAPAARTRLASLSLGPRLAVSRELGADQPQFWVGRGVRELRAVDSGQRLGMRFTRAGVLVRAAGGAVALGLVAVGRGDALGTVSRVAPVGARNRVWYTRPGVVEWYANGPLGLEQGFTLSDRPAGRAVAPVTLMVGMAGRLRPRLEAAGRELVLVGAGGHAVLRYGGLVVTDARGRMLRSWLALSGRRVLLRVDDAGASYPLRVDPYVQAAKLTASNGAPLDDLGDSVAAFGSTVVVGAPEANRGDGAVYVFTEPAGGWANATQSAELTASDGVGSLGGSVAIWEGCQRLSRTCPARAEGAIVAGAVNTTIGNNNAQGAVYVFSEPANGVWQNATQTATLTASNGAADDLLGSSVVVSGGTIAAGADGAAEGANASNSTDTGAQGAVYVFTEPTTGWQNATQTAELIASNGLSGDKLGTSVALSGDTIAAGAANATVGGNSGQGAVYVFTEPASGWHNAIQTAELTASTAPSPTNAGSAGLGSSVALSGSTMVAGARFAGHLGGDCEGGEQDGPGAVYVFTEPASGWQNSTQTAGLTASDGAICDQLGRSVAVSGSTIVAGAPGAFIANPARPGGGNTNQGAVYVFSEPASGWTNGTQTAKLTASDGLPSDDLGISVARWRCPGRRCSPALRA